MSLAYDPRAWYWVVADSATEVYSSAAGDYVPVADPEYQAFISRGETPTQIASAAELGEVLARYELRPTNAAVLDAFKAAQAVNLTVELVARIIFNHENRVRVLEGRPAVNAAQFQQAVKDLM